MVENLQRVATGALTLLIIFVAFAMIVGGKKGARWAINLILFPISPMRSGGSRPSCSFSWPSSSCTSWESTSSGVEPGHNG